MKLGLDSGGGIGPWDGKRGGPIPSGVNWGLEVRNREPTSELGVFTRGGAPGPEPGPGYRDWPEGVLGPDPGVGGGGPLF